MQSCSVSRRLISVQGFRKNGRAEKNQPKGFIAIKLIDFLFVEIVIYVTVVFS